jgi:hypothetical protein
LRQPDDLVAGRVAQQETSVLAANRSFWSSQNAKTLLLVSLVLDEDRRLLVSFLRGVKRLGGVFHGLPGKLMSAQVIFLAVMHGRGAVRVRGLLVEFSGSSVRVV